MYRPPLTVATMILAASCLLLSACGGSSHHYERVGLAGAVVALSGMGMALVTHATTSAEDQAHRPLLGVSAGLQIGGLLMGVYALDGLIRVTSEQQVMADDLLRDASTARIRTH